MLHVTNSVRSSVYQGPALRAVAGTAEDAQDIAEPFRCCNFCVWELKALLPAERNGKFCTGDPVASMEINASLLKHSWFFPLLDQLEQMIEHC